MQRKKIDLKDIRQLENSRAKHEKQDLETLMLSIKNDGLLQPIGVRKVSKGSKPYEIVFGNRRFEACKKLGYVDIDATIVKAKTQKDFLLLNLIENAQRSDITVYEQGRIFWHLKEKEDMSIGEIAVRVGVNKGRVKDSINVFQDTPKEFRDKIVFNQMGGGKGLDRKGKIPLSIASKIIDNCKRRNIKRSEMAKMLKDASNDNLNLEVVTDMFRAIDAGASTTKAIKTAKEVKVISVKFPVYKQDIERWVETYDGSIIEEIKTLVYNDRTLGLKKPF